MRQPGLYPRPTGGCPLGRRQRHCPPHSAPCPYSQDSGGGSGRRCLGVVRCPHPGGAEQQHPHRRQQHHHPAGTGQSGRSLQLHDGRLLRRDPGRNRPQRLVSGRRHRPGPVSLRGAECAPAWGGKCGQSRATRGSGAVYGDSGRRPAGRRRCQLFRATGLRGTAGAPYGPAAGGQRQPLAPARRRLAGRLLRAGLRHACPGAVRSL